MKVTIEITKSYLLIICGIIILSAGAIVYATNSGNPALMGHTGDEIASLPFDKLTPGISGNTELTANDLKLNYVPNEDFDAANKEYVDSKIDSLDEGYQYGYIGDSLVRGNFIQDGGLWTSYSFPRVATQSNGFLPVYMANTETNRDAVCLGIGHTGATYSGHVEASNNCPHYATCSVANFNFGTGKWSITTIPSGSTYVTLSEVRCDEW